jgi:hypothetical protein
MPASPLKACQFLALIPKVKNKNQLFPMLSLRHRDFFQPETGGTVPDPEPAHR